MLYSQKPSDIDFKIEIVSCIIEYDGKILLLLRQNHKSYPNKWGPPAGKVENGEDIKQAIIRETFEETGIKLNSENVEYIRESYVIHGSFAFIYHEFFYRLNDYEEIIIHSDEHKDYSWFDMKESLKLDLVDDQDVCIKNLIFDKENGLI